VFRILASILSLLVPAVVIRSSPLIASVIRYVCDKPFVSLVMPLLAFTSISKPLREREIERERERERKR